MTTITNARNTDPVTSKMAAASLGSTHTTLAMRLLQQFSKRSQTAEMAATDALLLHTGYWKRVSDLKRDGLITERLDSKGNLMHWPTLSGRRAVVLKITPEGRKALKEYRASLTKAA